MKNKKSEELRLLEGVDTKIKPKLEDKISRQKTILSKIDKVYYKTISGEEILWDDTQVVALCKEKKGLYKEISIKECEIGMLYQVIKDDTHGENAIIIQKI